MRDEERVTKSKENDRSVSLIFNAPLHRTNATVE